MTRLTILRHGYDRWDVTSGETTGTVDRLKQILGGTALLRQLFGYDEARILTHRVESIGRPLKLGLILRVMSRGACYVEDESGHRRPLTVPVLARWAWRSVREPFQKAALLRRIEAQVAALETSEGNAGVRLDLSKSPAYLRTDLSFGLKAGGSVGHIAGVLNNLGEFGGSPIMLTTDLVPTVSPNIEVHTVAPSEAFWEYPEIPSFVMNDQFAGVAEAALPNRPLSFVYQRYSLNNFSGAALAVQRHVPFVLEYNGSEIWMSRHWGTPLEHERLSERIERANLTVSDLIVVVSQAMANELMGRGVPAAKILVNPNGVDVERYSPEIDGTKIRRQHELEGKTVVGFIGTFGPWHGAEVLARAIGRLMNSCPEYRSSVRVLMIGDGVKMPEVKAAFDEARVTDVVVLTGTIPQAEGPQYLAACDILASPHVPNADGTPFFGSPTKLFEYMAMGKGIVASDLDQIGEVLEHGRAARMVVPGEVDSLVDGLKALIDDPERRSALGREARRLAVERHTWRGHTRRIIERLRELVPARCPQ